MVLNYCYELYLLRRGNLIDGVAVDEHTDKATTNYKYEKVC